tara:strand:+ start:91960 stop:92280 length:321 start_codon:yes stop_codon:yes gene_type:complete
MAIKRIWHGWTPPEHADTYRTILEGQVLPGIKAKNIPGFRALELHSRDLGDEVEFMTIMTFDSLDDVIAFQGEDYKQAYVPSEAQAVLSRWDKVCAHYEILENRSE